MDKKTLYYGILKHKVDYMSGKVVPLPQNRLAELKEQQHLTITELSKMTKVNRDVVKRFLDGNKINHIDYIKIVKVFPEIHEISDKKILEVTPIGIFGSVEAGGYVRGLYLNEQKEFLLDKPLTSIFTDEIVALHDTFSNNKFVCIHRPNKTSFNREDHNYMYLVKTKTDCWFGLIKEHNNHFCLHDRHKLEPISVKELEIIEVFEMLAFVSGRWNELKDKNLHSVVKR